MTKTNTTSVRFTLDFADKTIVGTKASFTKAGKGFGPVYDELTALMAKHPDFKCAVKEPKKPTKGKQTYKGMDISFMLDYASAVGQPEFRSKMVNVRDFVKENDGSAYPVVKRMFLEHFAPEANRRFAYGAAKVIVSNYRYKGIITAATEHTEPIPANDAAEGNTEALAAVANF